jgi:hypothetical protein
MGGRRTVFYIYRSYGVPRGIRTPDLRFRKPLLYPAELWRLASVPVFVGKYFECVNTHIEHWRSRRDLNPRPSVPETDALSTELRERAGLKALDGKDGAPGGTRTPNPSFRRAVLYPIELRAQPGVLGAVRTRGLRIRNPALFRLSYENKTTILLYSLLPPKTAGKMVPGTGVEPVTPAFSVQCSTS